jgi:hypothetical protein
MLMAIDISIIDVLRDEKLLGQFLKTPETWVSWFTFLRAFFSLPAESGDVDLFKSCTGRAHWPEGAFSEAWLIIGTRGGKSFITALIATFLSVFR